MKTEQERKGQETYVEYLERTNAYLQNEVNELKYKLEQLGYGMEN